MRQIIKDIIEYVETGQRTESLQSACAEWSDLDVRLFCIKLSSWWARSTLMQSRHPYLSLSPACPWHPQFRAFVESIPELHELVRFHDGACHFSDTVAIEERSVINDYAKENYRPPLFTRSSAVGSENEGE
jgi:hypothetical protein